MLPEIFEERVKRLMEVNDVISKLAPSIQGAAFQVFIPYVTARAATGTSVDLEDARDDSDEQTPADFEVFLTKHTASDTKPAENVNLIAAYFYSQRGSEPFSTDEIRKTGDDAGLTIPRRIDMTLKGAKRDGKAIYTQVPAGGYKPTVFGETVLKASYGVKKGRQKSASDSTEA